MDISFELGNLPFNDVFPDYSQQTSTSTTIGSDGQQNQNSGRQNTSDVIFEESVYPDLIPDITDYPPNPPKKEEPVYTPQHGGPFETDIGTTEPPKAPEEFPDIYEPDGTPKQDPRQDIPYCDQVANPQPINYGDTGKNFEYGPEHYPEGYFPGGAGKGGQGIWNPDDTWEPPIGAGSTDLPAGTNGPDIPPISPDAVWNYGYMRMARNSQPGGIVQ